MKIKMAYQKTTYINNQLPALNEKNLNKTEEALKQVSMWQFLSCLTNADYLLERKNFQLETNSLIATIFDNAIDDSKEAKIIFENQTYELTLNQKTILGKDIQNQMIFLRYDGEKFNIFRPSNSKEVGEVGIIYSMTAPLNCKIIDGLEWNRQDYPKLWEYAEREIALGNKLFTEGNGSTTFKILQPNFPVSLKNETEFNTLGKQGGEKYHQLNEQEMPKHGHLLNEVQLFSINGKASKGYSLASDSMGVTVDSNGWWHQLPKGSMNAQLDGENQPHNNLPPYTVVNYWICYK